MIYISLTIITQLNIISIRNPSLWFHFSKKTAPTPSWKLAVPVTLFLIGSTFIAGKLANPLLIYRKNACLNIKLLPKSCQ